MSHQSESQTVILPAEFVGIAKAENDILNVGGVEIPMGGRWSDAPVYVRRSSRDLSVVEVAIAHHDGLAQEELDHQTEEADRYPLGPKEYWRTEMVGHSTYGPDGHLMTDAEFEDEWWGD